MPTRARSPIPTPIANITAALAAAIACAAAVHADPITILVDPLATDASINDVDLPNADGAPRLHVAAIDPDAAPRNRLFLFFPGTGASPTQYQIITRLASRVGYDALALVYDSSPSVRDLTKNDADPTLPERIRRERLFGEPLVDNIFVDRPNSIENRAIRALEFLQAQRPSERWDDYLTTDLAGNVGIDWSRVVVSGHSQGAGHSAYLAKQFDLAGIVMFAGPGDFVPQQGPAPWLFEPNVTPADRMFAFTHVDDATAQGFFSTQRILGLEAFGLRQNVDGLPRAALSSHMLSSEFPVARPDAHGAVVVDDRIPIDASGSPVYLAAWTYLLQEATSRACSPADLSSPRQPGEPDGVLTGADFFEFLDLFTAGDLAIDFSSPLEPGVPDGSLTGADFFEFLSLFSVGC